MNKSTVDYYKVHFLPQIEEAIIEHLQKIQPLTIMIFTESKITDIFNKFLDDDYYNIKYNNWYCNKNYFHDKNYIFRKITVDTNYHNAYDYKFTVKYIYNEFNMEGNTNENDYVQSVIDETRIKNLTPIIMFSNDIWPDIDGLQILKIGDKADLCYIVKDSSIRTKAALSNKNEFIKS